MNRLLRLLLTGLMALPAAGSIGCGKNEAKPNPELQVPDVPPSGRGAEGKSGKLPQGPKQK